jgi:hypothetical protein
LEAESDLDFLSHLTSDMASFLILLVDVEEDVFEEDDEQDDTKEKLESGEEAKSSESEGIGEDLEELEGAHSILKSTYFTFDSFWDLVFQFFGVEEEFLKDTEVFGVEFSGLVVFFCLAELNMLANVAFLRLHLLAVFNTVVSVELGDPTDSPGIMMEDGGLYLDLEAGVVCFGGGGPMHLVRERQVQPFLHKTQCGWKE